jgi:hypothetical protein
MKRIKRSEIENENDFSFFRPYFTGSNYRITFFNSTQIREEQMRRAQGQVRWAVVLLHPHLPAALGCAVRTACHRVP